MLFVIVCVFECLHFSCSTGPLCGLFLISFPPSVSSSADMSDIVPPEVRPKPAVPAKPPNVGAHSPSSPFPPQGPGIVGSSISAPPPSAIPVPIGNHSQSHVGSHGVGHGVGHGLGHAGSHAAANTGPHGHSGSHSSTGGSTLLGYIGIDTIIEQMRKKTMKTGFDFNIMVVGESRRTLLSYTFCVLFVDRFSSAASFFFSQVTVVSESPLW